MSSSSIFSKYTLGSYSPDLYLNNCERENIGVPSKKSSAITQLNKKLNSRNFPITQLILYIQERDYLLQILCINNIPHTLKKKCPLQVLLHHPSLQIPAHSDHYCKFTLDIFIIIKSIS